MSYRDPYVEQYARSNQYNDGPEYNPYGGNQQPHQTYAQEGYEPYSGPAEGYRDEPHVQSPEHTTFPPNFQGKEGGFVNGADMIPKDFRKQRYANQGGLWGGGGKARCIGRFCCCTVMTVIFLLISIVLCLLLWVRPPNIVIGTVGLPTSTSQIQVNNDSLSISMGVNISVENPNYFAVKFSKISANILYPINNTPIGNGSESDITFHSHSQTNFTFPFNIVYTKSLDPSNKILVDIATKCGFIGGTKSPITVDYKLTLGLRIGIINISPTVSNSMSFACPLTESEISSIGGSILGSL